MGEALIGLLGALLGAALSAVTTTWLQKRKVSDKDQFFSWRAVFDRGAFRGSFTFRSDSVRFVDAIRQTTRAVNTGTLFESGVGEYVQHRGKGKGQLRNAQWRGNMDEVERRLHNILVLAEGRVDGTPPPDVEACAIIDSERTAVIGIMNRIWATLGISPLPLPSASDDHYTFVAE
jgi:hypothetical protein